MKRFVNLKGKRLVFTPSATADIPPGAAGLIFPQDKGLIITDEFGDEKLFIEHEEATGLCWFLKVGRRGARRWFEPTNDVVLSAFGLNNLSYEASLILARQIHQQCKKHGTAKITH